MGDFLFTAFHTLLILFNLFGWIFRPLRRANLVVLLLTGASWFLLGIFYGFGYCPLTDWHFELLMKEGHYDLPDSFVSYLVEKLTGYLPGDRLTDIVVLVCYILAVGVSVYFNFFRKKK